MRDSGRPTPRLLPAFVLVLLAPLVAEASIGTAFVPGGAIAFLTLLPIYGGGALFVRELVIRRGGGFVAIAVLGIGYGVLEEGLALGSFFSPTIYEAIGPRWGGRVIGLNTVYTSFQLLNHALFSITVPIALVELCFPTLRRRPWLRLPGLVVSLLVFALGFAVLRLATVFTFDPGRQISAGWTVTSVIAVLLCGAVALGPTRRRIPWARTSAGAPPAPGALGSTAFLLTSVALAVLGVGGDLGVLTRTTWAAPVALLVALGCTAAGAAAVLHWSRSPAFDDRHRFALTAGALLGHTLVLGIIHPATTTAQLAVAGAAVATIALLTTLHHALSTRPKHLHHANTDADNR